MYATTMMRPIKLFRTEGQQIKLNKKEKQREPPQYVSYNSLWLSHNKICWLKILVKARKINNHIKDELLTKVNYSA